MTAIADTHITGTAPHPLGMRGWVRAPERLSRPIPIGGLRVSARMTSRATDRAPAGSDAPPGTAWIIQSHPTGRYALPPPSALHRPNAPAGQIGSHRENMDEGLVEPVSGIGGCHGDNRPTSRDGGTWGISPVLALSL